MPLADVFSLLVLGQGKSGLDVARWALAHPERVSAVTVYGGGTSEPNDATRALEAAGASFVYGTEQVEGAYDVCVTCPGISEFSGFFKAGREHAAQIMGEPEFAYRLSPDNWIAITGTNGKTTTTFLVEHIARVAGKRTGVIGTVGVRVGDERAKTAHTTPESPDLQELFARMRDAHCDVVAMEVSSHALDLRRTWATRFAVTAFTNLTQDHLDYHHTFEAYFEAKALLFSKDYPAKRVICIDDKWGRELLRRCSAAGDNVVTTGFDPSAQIHPGEIVYAPTHTSVELHVRGERFRFDYPLAGRFNVSNIMNAFGIGLQLGIPADLIVQALSESPQVPGRLERVHAAHDGGVSVFVDYAHTPDALKKALSSIIALTPGRTICVFGCGGDRDAGKRSIMGREALEADYAIVTSDNPRSEDPLAIIADIESGMGAGSGRYEVVPDRRGAIARALEIARAGDSVLIAGKGHEDYQLIGDKVLHFDDREVAAEELERRFGGPAAGEGVE